MFRAAHWQLSLGRDNTGFTGSHYTGLHQYTGCNALLLAERSWEGRYKRKEKHMQEKMNRTCGDDDIIFFLRALSVISCRNSFDGFPSHRMACFLEIHGVKSVGSIYCQTQSVDSLYEHCASVQP